MNDEKSLRNKIVLTIICVFVLCVGLTATLLSKNDRTRVETKQKNMPIKERVERPEELVNCIRIGYSDKTIWVPTSPKIETDTVTGKIDGFDYLLFQSSEEVQDTLLSIPERFYNAILGGKSKVTVLQTKDGYIGNVFTTHMLSKAKIKISLREETYYFVSYMADVCDIGKFYLSVACTDKSQVRTAQEALDKMASSITKYEDNSYIIQDAIRKEAVTGSVVGEEEEKKESDAKKEDKEENLDYGSTRYKRVLVPIERAADIICIVYDDTLGEPDIKVKDPSGQELVKLSTGKDGIWFYEAYGETGRYTIDGYEGSSFDTIALQGLTKEEYELLLKQM